VRHVRNLAIAVLAAGALITGVALAAASPTVSTGSASNITNTGATLTGTVNPNGASSSYEFLYGPTTAYGSTTPATSAGHGSKKVSVTKKLTGLTPGTTYHYRITAVNAGGTGTGSDKSFTTSGHPPAAVVTGATVGVGKMQATPTGTIDPEGAITEWVVQYGLTTSYGFETFVQTLSALSTPQPVSAQLVGLAPATLFHYRLVAYHGSTVVSMGLDGTFFTEPLIRPKPRLEASVSPRKVKRRPFTFTTSGVLRGNTFIPAAQRCAGHVTVRFQDGRRALSPAIAPVDSNCRFTVTQTFSSLHPVAPTRLRVTVSNGATGYLAPASRTLHVTVG
jgi:Fibronectin type III domain